MQPVLSVNSVSKAYRGVPAVAEASLDLYSGRITCLLGPSGCGKSTLLRLIAGLEPVDAGEIQAAGRLLSGRDAMAPPQERGIGLVFQDFALFPHLSVVENVGFGLRKVKGKGKRERAIALLDQFRLADRADAWPHTLSGGEQQRVAIARALAREPAAILLDEPFSGLDGDLKAEVRHAVLSGLRQAEAAVLIVTHDPEEALLMADALALMAEGCILQRGSPEQCYLKPATAAAARLLGEANLLPARIEDGEAVTVFGPVPAGDHADGPATLMVRPEGLRLDPDGSPAEIVRVRFGGAFHEVTVTSEGVEATLRRTGGPVPSKGPARVRIDPSRACIFPAKAKT
jgi:iron(III) transport system ATP-binding protein